MDRYRSPQSLDGAALTIGAPRPLRSHTVDRTPVMRSNVPLSPAPVMPTPMPSRFQPPAEESIRQPQPRLPVTMEFTSQSSDAGDEAHARRGSGTGFFGGIMNGFRRIPRVMQKHHSRQSLYEEYIAEAQAAARARLSQMSPNQGLGSIQESVEGDGAYIMESSRPGQSSSDTYDDGTNAVHYNNNIPRPIAMWPINSPAYTNSQLDSSTSRAESSIGPLPPDDTWAYYFAIILLFINHIRKLPWSSHRIVSDYVPSRDGRGHFGENRPANVWYKPRKRGAGRDAEKAGTLSPPEVIVVPATPRTASYLSNNFGYGVAPVPPPIVFPMVATPFSDGAVTAIRPTHTPATGTSGGFGYPSPGMSSHGMGRHDLTMSWYSSSPQQWAPHRSEFDSPQTRMTTGGSMYGPP